MVTALNLTLTARQQALLTLANQPESMGYDRSATEDLHEAVRQILLEKIGRNDRVADLGVGKGLVGRILHDRQSGHLDLIFGCDISENRLRAAEDQRTYSNLWLVGAHDFCRQMARQATFFDWVTLIGVAQYLEPFELAELLDLIEPITRKGLIMTVECVPEQVQARLLALSPPVSVYDHSRTWTPGESGFEKCEFVMSESWCDAPTKLNVPVDIWCFRKAQQPMPVS